METKRFKSAQKQAIDIDKNLQKKKTGSKEGWLQWSERIMGGGNIVESMGARTEIDAKKQRTSKKTKESVKKTKSKQFIGA